MGPEIARINRDVAKTDPEAAFERPEAVLEEVALTRGEKLSVLSRWEELVEQRLAAGNEGMPTRGSEPVDADLVRRIGLTKLALEGEETIE